MSVFMGKHISSLIRACVAMNTDIYHRSWRLTPVEEVYFWSNLGVRAINKMSQNVDIGLVFGLCDVEVRIIFKNDKKLQKLPVFCHKIKTRAKTTILRHASLDKNVVYTYSKFGTFAIYPCSKNKSRKITYKLALFLLYIYQQYPVYH